MKYAKQPKDPRGGHARLYWSILDSPAWRALTHADVRVYLALRRKLGRTNNGDINATLAEMKHSGISSSSTLSTALHRLETLGFIEKTRQGGIANGGKLCSLYRFTDEPTFDIVKAGVRAAAATNEWQQFGKVSEAKAAVRHFKRKNKPKLRNSTRSDTVVESDTAIRAPTIERVPVSPVRPSARKRKRKNELEPA